MDRNLPEYREFVRFFKKNLETSPLGFTVREFVRFIFCLSEDFSDHCVGLTVPISKQFLRY